MNMSYCKFQNTLQALRDCSYSMDEELSEEEAMAKKQLIKLCQEIIEVSEESEYQQTNEEK